jgi:polyphosphate kinase
MPQLIRVVGLAVAIALIASFSRADEDLASIAEPPSSSSPLDTAPPSPAPPPSAPSPVPTWALTDVHGAFADGGSEGAWEWDTENGDDEGDDEGNGDDEGRGGSPLGPEPPQPHLYPLVAITSPEGSTEWVPRYINRELSWLAFNERVLSEASSPRHPLLERLRFLSISHSNLDEFVTVRIAGLKQLASSSVQSLSADGLNPTQQLAAIYRACADLQTSQQDLWTNLRKQIADEAGLVIVDVADLKDGLREWVKNFFLDEMWPQLSPQSLDPAHPFPFIPGKGMGLLLTLTLADSGTGGWGGNKRSRDDRGKSKRGGGGGGGAGKRSKRPRGMSSSSSSSSPPGGSSSASADINAAGAADTVPHMAGEEAHSGDGHRKGGQQHSSSSSHHVAPSGPEMRVIIPFPPTLQRFIRLPDLDGNGNGGSAAAGSAGAASSKASAAGVRYSSSRPSGANGNGSGHAESAAAAGATGGPAAGAGSASSGSAAAPATPTNSTANGGGGGGVPHVHPPTRPPVVRFVLAEDIIRTFLGSFFPNFRVREVGTFRLLRDSEVEIDEEAIDLVRMFESALKRRRKGVVIHLAVDSNMPPEMVHFLSKNVDLPREQVSQVGLVGLADVKQLILADNRAAFLFRPFTARFPPRIADYGGDVLAAIRAKDIVVHHPYESFDVVLQFMRQAARDPNVVAIKQTLYRTSDDSPIVRELIHAAESGKTVTALIELKARFDEEANIRWARDMQRAGVQVVYGFVELKTHAKVALVVRREDGGLRSYIHVGTGNYHPVTAKVYTDVSFFSADSVLCRDAAKLFNYMTGYGKPSDMERIAISPLFLRDRIESLVRNEIANARKGLPAQIWAKMNALVDTQIIDLLYEASEEGVEIDIIVRGMCALRPGVPGLSSRIRVRSIIGRFLEHSRIFAFANGSPMPSPQAAVFISSADWMTRNLDWRVEAFVPLTNPTVHAQVLGEIFARSMEDTVNSWALDPSGDYRRVREIGPGPVTPEDEAALVGGEDCHRYFMTHASLSGRGTGATDAPRSVRPRRGEADI